MFSLRSRSRSFFFLLARRSNNRAISFFVCGLLGLGGAAGVGLMGCDSEIYVARRPPLLVVNTDRIDFGSVPVGLDIRRSITLLNSGEEGLVVREMAAQGSDAFTVAESSLTIAANQQVELVVRFAPATEGTAEAELLLVSNANNVAEAKVALVGNGSANPLCGACDAPPDWYCAGERELIVYTANGQCVEGECRYDASVVNCPQRCDVARGRCSDAPDVPDAGPHDAHVVDAAAPSADAGMDDAGGAAPGTLDGGMPDAGALDASSPPQSEPQAIFSEPGEHTYVVPNDITRLTARLWGGGGGGGGQQGATGGGGGFATAEFAVTPGETLTVRVAQGGQAPGDGGGMSSLLRNGEALLVGGGGGGGGSDGCSGCKSGGGGGAGGGIVGEDGQALLAGFNGYCTGASGGTGGDQTSGGQGGTTSGSAEHHCPGRPGASGTGGNATGVNGDCNESGGATDWQAGGGQGNGGGGGGGAGYFGGGSAGFIWTYCGGGGGGGSSWATPAAVNQSLMAGQGQTPGNPTEAAGAARGGDRLQNGAAGRVELGW